MPSSADDTLDVSSEARSGDDTLALLVFTGDGAATHPLPRSGPVTIGRAPEANIRIDAPSLSRQHAVLEMGPALRIQDSGSANGTRVGDKAVLAGNWAPVQPGDVIEMGSVILVVQRSRRLSKPRRVWTHSAFETRVDEECRRGAPFSIVRLRLRGKAAAGSVAEALTIELRHGDCLAAFAPGEYEALLAGAGADKAAERADDFVARLEEVGVDAATGIATFPADGREPDALLARAGRRLGTEHEGALDGAIVVQDPAMEQLYRVVDRLARGEIGVLITGETGVGKEVVAEEIHRRSPRRNGPYVRVNCAALTEGLFESELFGHEKGSFTGATDAKVGLLEAANGGTVFLDEIGELTPSMQSKMLRVVEERAVRRVGSVKSRPIDVRFLAATNRNLETDVGAGRFRQDLFYRLGAVLVVPSLRERRSEIEPLSRSFIVRECTRLGRRPLGLTASALARLATYPWPGNIRELRNVIERAVLLCEGDAIDLEHLPLEKMAAPLIPSGAAPEPARPTDSSDSSSGERERVLDALQRTAGNQKEAAKLLGISRRTLLYRLDAYGIPRPRKKAPEG